ncbi:hypothetical protein G9A89_023786 [Geosiphon pyriformis]|nr:hypothetical protein G9A89_023786 [Geosiphon pyriformis]
MSLKSIQDKKESCNDDDIPDEIKFSSLNDNEKLRFGLEEIRKIYKVGCDLWQEDYIILKEVNTWLALPDRPQPKWIFKLLEEKKDDLEYICLRGFMTRWGIGTQTDRKEAYSWFKLAAENGDPLGQNECGGFWDFGLHETADKEKAFYWYKKSAEGGYVLAMSNVATFYFQGMAYEKDNRKGLYWATKSASRGFCWSYKMMGEANHYGLGKQRDIHAAIKWYRKSYGKVDTRPRTKTALHLLFGTKR